MTLGVLFDAAAHEPLGGEAWDAGRVRAGVEAIVADAEAAFDDGWLIHPLDDAGEVRRPRGVYLGGAGVVYALDELRRRGLVDLRRDYASYLDHPYEPDLAGSDDRRGLLLGETGIRLVLQRLAPSGANLDRLAALIEANAQDERCDLVWGSPGTMLAARALHRSTGEVRWLELWRASAAALREARDERTGLWTQRIDGKEARYLGPAHGFAGCALALAAEPDADLDRRVADVARRYAVEHDGMANWPVDASDPGLERNGTIRTQWCHGAPGIVATLAASARGDDEHDRLMLAGGELTWRAGPLAKGPGLCHGTAGNGHAFLALLERAGDEHWLARARAFAMHALGQVERERAAHGRGRHTLWTGDLGVALYLADCLDGRGALPLA